MARSKPSTAGPARLPRLARLWGSRPASLSGLSVALAASALLGCSNAAGPEQPMSGEQIYNRQCARCHGLDGRPTKASPGARDLTMRGYMDGLGNKGIRAAIMAGRPVGAPPDQQLMPAFGNQFSEPELELLVGYVRSLSNPELGPDQHTPEAVQARTGE